jgi:hypothetical protein
LARRSRISGRAVFESILFRISPLNLGARAVDVSPEEIRMETFALLAVALVALPSMVVGARLLIVSRRTRGFPEFVLGFSLASITGIGFPIVLLTEFREAIGPALTFAADFVGSFVVALGFAGFYVFTWRVFRPGSRWALPLTLLGAGAALLATAATVWLAVGAESGEEKFQLVRGWEILLFTSAAAGFLWSAVEALRYHAMLRRRLAIGLSDVVVANRVLLWGLTGVTAGAALVILTLLRLADVNYMSAPVALFTAAVCGLLASLFLYLAFLPPAAYLRWLRSGDPVEGSTASPPPG